MKSERVNWLIAFVVMAALLSTGGGLAYASKKTEVKPDLAAKRERVRTQQEQRITPEKRKAAVDALKAERLKVYEAKQFVAKSKEKDKEKDKDNK